MLQDNAKGHIAPVQGNFGLDGESVENYGIVGLVICGNIVISERITPISPHSSV